MAKAAPRRPAPPPHSLSGEVAAVAFHATVIEKSSGWRTITLVAIARSRFVASLVLLGSRGPRFLRRAGTGAGAPPYLADGHLRPALARPRG
jgi:hypothetical protein